MRSLRAAVGVGLLASFGICAAKPPDDARKAGLQALNDYIGVWKGSGGPDKPRPGPNDPTWSETIQWSWRFKGDDVWLSLEVQDGKYFGSGEVRYLPDRKAYQLAIVDRKRQTLTYEG